MYVDLHVLFRRLSSKQLRHLYSYGLRKLSRSKSLECIMCGASVANLPTYEMQITAITSDIQLPCLDQSALRSFTNTGLGYYAQ